MTESDIHLMQQAQCGDAAAFAALVDRYRPALVRVARSRLACETAAEDVAQEALLSAYRSRHTFDPRYGFRTWLWTILLNHCRRWGGREQRTPGAWPAGEATDAASRDRTCGETAAEGLSPLSLLLARERAELLDRMLGELRPEMADALRLRFFAELKFQEIADAMQCSLGTAKNRVRAGLLALSARLERDEVFGALSPVRRGDVDAESEDARR